ncbi:L-arabinose transport system permease protein AraQ [Meiothermus luteus]|jgi:putative aldouronate transport system permease protein|uniref:L-arabinose transport system permease protein AraQ n=1 Tax=Meiothermus luteus TaxID=2026184 RepID=A0A399EV15_9DEIN|nr:carbohydrate ABC transporter permease [Meiothermus luteus]RIH88467.1 L-arabinose transport system permease protein AraQ [Meiothermus luteus]RMH57333.1 MAG: ABC transporter permease subunit [Deinococcota bacterium]
MARKILSRSDRWFEWSVDAFLVLVLVITLVPMWYVVMVSLLPFGERPSLWLPPWKWSFEAYAQLVGQPSIWRALLNSVILTVGGVFISLSLTVLAAYPLSRRDLPGRGLIVGLILFTFLFNAGLIPTFLVVKDLGLLNTYWAILLNGAISVYNLLVLKTFFQSIPESLEEAARIDGASDFQVLWHVVLPLSKPALLTIGLFYGVANWNNFFEPILFLSDRNLMPLPVVLRDILTGLNVAEYVEGSAAQAAPAEALKMASVVLITLPMLLVYPWLQRHFTKGVLIGSVKE